MPRAGWFVLGLITLVVVSGVLLMARGPFGAHPAVTYDRFLADLQAGQVTHIVQWRDQLEVTLDDAVVSVTVPADRDLATDLGMARWAGGVGISIATVSGMWLLQDTPWLPILLALVAVLIWVTAVGRDGSRRAATPRAEPEPLTT